MELENFKLNNSLLYLKFNCVPPLKYNLLNFNFLYKYASYKGKKNKTIIKLKSQNA